MVRNELYSEFMKWFIKKLKIKYIDVNKITHYFHLYAFITKTTDEINFNNELIIKTRFAIINEPKNSSYYVFSQMIKYDTDMSTYFKTGIKTLGSMQISLDVKCSNDFLSFIAEYSQLYNQKQKLIQIGIDAKNKITGFAQTIKSKTLNVNQISNFFNGTNSSSKTISLNESNNLSKENLYESDDEF